MKELNFLIKELVESGYDVPSGLEYEDDQYVGLMNYMDRVVKEVDLFQGMGRLIKIGRLTQDQYFISDAHDIGTLGNIESRLFTTVEDGITYDVYDMFEEKIKVFDSFSDFEAYVKSEGIEHESKKVLEEELEYIK